MKTREVTLTPSEFVRQIEDGVKGYIRRFFDDKRDRSGKPVSAELIECDDAITLVMETEPPKGIDRIYDSLHAHGVPDESGGFGVDCQMMIRCYTECARRGIPKQFASGIILLYLEHCLDFREK